MCRNEGTFIQNAATEKLTQPAQLELFEPYYSLTSEMSSSDYTTGYLAHGKPWPMNRAIVLRVGCVELDDKGPCNVCGCRLYMKVEEVRHDSEEEG
jgi:hypothetical protein